MSLLTRIVRQLLARPEADEPPADAERVGGRRRRRGRRGGRGRGGGGGKTTTTEAAATTDQRGSRGREATRGRRRTPRAMLDEPLPEDIAFRPASEGGDGSILAAHRRPPPGPRITRRVMLGGSRYVTGFSASEPPQPMRPDSDTAAEETVENSADSGQRRRRRGRRGGRGRRRNGSGSAEAAQ